MEPFYEDTHYSAGEALDLAARIVRDIENGLAPSGDVVLELSSVADDCLSVFLAEQEKHQEEPA